MTALSLTVCPLRGSLGEKRYTNLRPAGELAIESALLLPSRATSVDGWFAGRFHRFGVWTGPLTGDVLAQLSAEIRGDVPASAVLVDEFVSGRTMSALDSGAVVVRAGIGARAHLMRTWVRFAPLR